jgi:hypothetical protein
MSAGGPSGPIVGRRFISWVLRESVQSAQHVPKPKSRFSKIQIESRQRLTILVLRGSMPKRATPPVYVERPRRARAAEAMKRDGYAALRKLQMQQNASNCSARGNQIL